MQIPLHRTTSEKQDVVVVKLWADYLKFPAGNLLEVLSGYSIDSAPIGSGLNDRLTFRFHSATWAENVKAILYENRIPVRIQSNPFYAVKRGLARKNAISPLA